MTIPAASPVVRLRAVEAADLPIFFENQRDPVGCAMAVFPPRDREAFDAHWAKILADPVVTNRTILADGRVAGNVAVFPLLGKPTVGYWIGREFWGKGIATRGLSLLVAEVATRPLFAHVGKANTGSIRVLEKCGFVVCGEDRGSARPRGEPIEEFVFELRAP